MDQSGYHELYERHARDVFRFAFYLCGRRDEAEDIASETFLRAWIAADTIRTETVKAYLFSIARNLVREAARKHAGPVEVSEDLPDTDAGPALRAENRQHLAAVLRALQSLPADDRAALLMRVQDGMPHEEIARALGLSVTAVKVRVHRARLKLDALRIREERKP